MKLIELEPEFIRVSENGNHAFVDSLAEAQGIWFKCPACFIANGGIVGTHMVMCWSRSRGVPDDVTPLPGRWILSGTGFDDLSFLPEPPETRRSIQLLGGGCNAHFNISNGQVDLC